MSLEVIINQIKKVKFFIVISLVLAIVIGCFIGYLLNRPLYRSAADVYIYRISRNIEASFDENFYYLFYRYFKNSNNFDSDISVDYLQSERVHANAYEKVIEAGYDISYKEYKAGISLYDRESNVISRLTVIYPDKVLSEFVLTSILDEAEKLFNSDITGRIEVEIQNRYIKEQALKDSLMDKITELDLKKEEVENGNSSSGLTAELAVINEEVNAIMELFKDNNSHILRLEQVADFPFWELHERNTDIIETGVAVPRNILSIGMTAFVLTLLLWMIGFYISYTVKKIRGKNDKA